MSIDPNAQQSYLYNQFDQARGAIAPTYNTSLNVSFNEASIDAQAQGQAQNVGLNNTAQNNLAGPANGIQTGYDHHNVAYQVNDVGYNLQGVAYGMQPAGGLGELFGAADNLVNDVRNSLQGPQQPQSQIQPQQVASIDPPPIRVAPPSPSGMGA